jgi:Asp-tRNA(Asn)/Glu-tRNA(Gln) amidotransferase B subunit
MNKELIKELATLSEMNPKMVSLILATWTPLPEANLILSKLMINDIQSRLDADGDTWADMDTYHYGFKQLLLECARGRAAGVLDARQIKKIIDDCWSYPYVGYDLIQYVIKSKLFDGEVAGDELTAIIKKAMEANPKAVAELKQGKDKAIGALVGAVMKQQKASPQEVQAIIRSLL